MSRMAHGNSAVMSLATIRYTRLSLANVESRKTCTSKEHALGNQRRARLLGGCSASSSFGLGAALALALPAAAFTLALALALETALGFGVAATFGVNGLAPDFEIQAGPEKYH
eukprot:s324_g3.t1